MPSMLNDLSIRKKLYISLGAIVAIVLALLATAYVNFIGLSAYFKWI